MKRDPDLIRELLLSLEQKPDDKVDILPSIDGYTDSESRYHCRLLAQAGYVDFEPELTKTGRIIKVYVFNLSWKGQKFLEASRDETLWKKGLAVVAAQTGGVAIDLLRAWLLHQAKHQLGIDMS